MGSASIKEKKKIPRHIFQKSLKGDIFPHIYKPLIIVPDKF